MFERGLAILSVILIAYILYRVVPLIINKYFTAKPAPVESFAKYTAAPAPAPSTGAYPTEPVRVTAPAGPNSPNSVPVVPAEQKKIPDENPADPSMEAQAELPIQTDLRQPERMFSKPPPNTGVSQLVSSGIGGETVKSPSSSGKFSPDLSQNGGEFMTGIFANDLSSTGSMFSEI